MRLNRARRQWLMIVCASTMGLAPAEAIAQSMDGTGAVATGLLLRRMDGVKRVLMIGAHPDDEDTSFLTTLSRGWGAETAYLSLTRGGGGQNLIGSELWEGLGIIRTGELVAARKLDGGSQFFARAFDFGYSKSADEALSLWPREELLADVVWIVRTYRPQIIVSVWSGTPQDGHGHHQAAGIVAREAFEAAGDPTRFAEQLARGVEAWTPDKLYQSSRRRFGRGGGANDGSLSIETGALDPLLGRSLLQLSMVSRSQHRSQNMGAPQPPGPRSTGVSLVESRVRDDGATIFSGVDTTLVGLAGALPDDVRAATRVHLEAYRAAVSRAVDGFGLDLSKIVPDLTDAFGQLAQAIQSAGPSADAEFLRATAQKVNLVTRAIFAAAGVSFDVRALDDLVVPGETVRVQAQLWNGSDYELWLPEVELGVPSGWRVTEASVAGLAADGNVSAASLVTWTYDVAIPEDAALSKLYYLLEKRDGARYRWPDDPTLWGLPRDPALVHGRARFGLVEDGEALGDRLTAAAAWHYVGVDPARGEFEKPVLVVPAVSVSVTPAGVVWPRGRSSARSISVVVRSEAEAGSQGTVTAQAPAGWSVSPSSRQFELATAGAERTMVFEIAPDGETSPGEHVFEFVARTVDGEYDEGFALIDYDHIERAALYAPAAATVSVVPVVVSDGLRVGYIMGPGDDGPEAIRHMGAAVELLDEARVRNGAFAEYDVVVLGVRAYETRPDLRAAGDRLLDFARAGGTVIVQYNRGPLGALAPAPIQTGRGSPRVADETAPVRILEPDAPIFTTPNRIGAEDFDGWVQERGLYFAAQWDDAYVPMLELNDPGEEPRQGALLVTTVGDGVFIYTALSFFRQWAGRVPGAYRLFANLISLDATNWSAFEGRR